MLLLVTQQDELSPLYWEFCNDPTENTEIQAHILADEKPHITFSVAIHDPLTIRRFLT